MKVKNYKDYACFNYTPYLNRKDEPMKAPPKGCPYDLGDIVVLTETNALGVVLGCIGEDGDLRTDADGMRCWSSPGYLRLATSADIRNSKLSRSDRLNQELNKSQTVSLKS